MMRRLLVGLVLVCLALSATSADNAKSGVPACDCTRFPYLPHPPCANYCTAKTLQALDEAGLVELGLSPQVANRIAAIPGDQRPTSIEGYQALLGNGADFRALEARMGSFDKKDFDATRLAVRPMSHEAPVVANSGTIKVGVLHSLSGTMAISESVLKDTVLMAISRVHYSIQHLPQRDEARLPRPKAT